MVHVLKTKINVNEIDKANTDFVVPAVFDALAKTDITISLLRFYVFINFVTFINSRSVRL